MTDESDYYKAQREDEYDPEAAPYEPIAPDLAGQSPLGEWRKTEAKPMRFGGQVEQDSGMQLREASVIGTSPTPDPEQVQGAPETYTTPTYWGEANVRAANEIVGGRPISTQDFTSKSLRAVQQIASGIYQKAADVFSKSRWGGD